MDSNEFDVSVDAGIVTLTGSVNSITEKRAAGDDAWDTLGVIDFNNNLTIETQNTERYSQEDMKMQFKEGTDVFTADGEKAGEIERVVIDPLTEEVTHIVVEKGFLFPEDKVVPVNLVQKATEERVDLRVIEDLDTLPP